MKISIENVPITESVINSFQLMSNWNSLYSKGRLLLSVNNLTAQSILKPSSFFTGADVTFSFGKGKEVYFKIFAFNFLQSDDKQGSTSGELLELILISPWYIDAPLKDASYFGTGAEIIRELVTDSNSFEESLIEDTADPSRRRYQLGITHWNFAETLKPYLTGTKTPSFLFNSLFGKKINLRTFDSIREQESTLTIVAPDSNIKIKSGEVVAFLRNASFFFNEGKELDDAYAITEISKELQLDTPWDIKNQVTDSTAFETLAPFNSEGYVNEVEYAKWDHSPAEQRILALRKKFVSEIEYNVASIILPEIYVDLELADKISINLNKSSEYQNRILSTEYIIKDLLISYDADDDENTFSKFVGIPLIYLD